MPAPRHPCAVCPTLVPAGVSRCTTHARPAWQGSGKGRGRNGWEWQRTVTRILIRDGYVCRYCGGEANTADHRVPLARGGSDTDANLVAACRPCNQRKARTTDRGEAISPTEGPGTAPPVSSHPVRVSDVQSGR